jgi:Erv1 / Alr family
MDTKFWGPSGWKFLHLITFSDAIESKAAIRCFFETLPYVLPCKFCRQSLSEYMKKIPLDTAAPAKWLWKIHNCVNGKLRSQGLNTEADPPFSVVKKLYTDKFAAGCTKTNFEGWEFLFSIVENHPYSKSATGSLPIKDAPEHIDPADTLELNRWNMLAPEKRAVFYEQFWNCLPRVLPYPEWKKVWEACPTDWSSRQAAMRTLWGVRCSMESALQLMNKTNYHSLCKQLRTHRSGCSKSTRAKTCRKKRGT